MSDAAARHAAGPDTLQLPRTGTGTRAPGWWGMLLFCITEGSLFLYFVGSYFYLRGSATAFEAEGGKYPPLGIPALLTVLLVSSSVSLRWGELGIRRGDVRRLVAGLVTTIVLGAAFLGVQTFEYARLEHMPQTDAYWSAFYTITGFHGMHVLLGLSMLGMNLFRASRGHFTAERHLAVQNGGLYWHTVDIVWIVIVSALYLSPRLWSP